jgi:hypothetical protein
MALLTPDNPDDDEFLNEYEEMKQTEFMEVPFAQVFNDSCAWLLPKPWVGVVRSYHYNKKGRLTKIKESAYKREGSLVTYVARLQQNPYCCGLLYDPHAMAEWEKPDPNEAND